MKLIYFSITGQTRRFVNKTNLEHEEILPNDPEFEANEDFLIIVPSYADETPGAEKAWTLWTQSLNLCPMPITHNTVKALSVQEIEILLLYIYLPQKNYPLNSKFLLFTISNLMAHRAM